MLRKLYTLGPTRLVALICVILLNACAEHRSSKGSASIRSQSEQVANSLTAVSEVAVLNKDPERSSFVSFQTNRITQYGAIAVPNPLSFTGSNPVEKIQLIIKFPKEHSSASFLSRTEVNTYCKHLKKVRFLNAKFVSMSARTESIHVCLDVKGAVLFRIAIMHLHQGHIVLIGKDGGIDGIGQSKQLEELIRRCYPYVEGEKMGTHK